MKHKPYDEYKDSGVEWIGDIPEGWNIKRFKHFVRFQEGPGILAKDFRDSGVPLLRISCMQKSIVTLEGCNYLDEEMVNNKWPHFRLNIGDILISASASMGNVCEIGKEAMGSIAYTGLIRLTVDENRTNKSYLQYFIQSNLFSEQINQFKTGSTIQHFGPTHLNQMLFIHVPLPEQAAIANYLDAATAKISTIIVAKQKLIEKLQEKRSSIISHAVTKGLDPTAKMKPSGIEWIGDIPEKWEVLRMNRIFDIKAGGDLKEHLFSETKSSEFCYPIYTNSVKLDEVYGYTKMAYFKGNTITVTGRGDIGFAVYRYSPYDAIIRLLVLTPKNNSYCKYYSYFINAILDFSVGSSAINQLSTQQIAPSLVCLPSQAEQTAIADYLDTETAKIDAIITKTKTSMEKLNEYKTALISACVTGKIDVRGAR